MKNRKMGIRYFATYLTAFLIAFMSSILMYHTVANNLKNDVIIQFESRQKEGNAQMEAMLSRMGMADIALEQSADFTSVVNKTQEYLNSEVTRLKQSYKTLYTIGSVSDFTYAFVLMNRNNAYISTSQVSLNFDDSYYGTFLYMEREGFELSTAENVREALFASYQNGQLYFPLDSLTYTADGKTKALKNPVLYLVSSGAVYLNPDYLFCFVIDRDTMLHHYLYSSGYGDVFLRIEDSMGTGLLEYGNVPEVVTEGDKKSMQREGYHVLVNENHEIGWKITTGISMSGIREMMRPAYNLLMVYMGFGIAAVVGLTLFFTLRSTRGFQKVYRIFPEESEPLGEEYESQETGYIESVAQMNEFSILADKVDRLKRSGDYYRLRAEELRRRNDAIRLEQLLTAGFSLEEEREFIDRIFERVPEFYCIAVLRVLQQEKGTYEELILDLKQQMGETFEAQIINVHRGISDELFLFELLPQQQPNTGGPRDLFKCVLPDITERYEAVLHVGLSSVGSDLANTGRCCRQADQIVQAQYLYENENRVEVYDVHATASGENLVSIDFLQRFYSMLLFGQRDKAQEEIHRLQYSFRKMPFFYEVQKEQIYYSMKNVFYSSGLQFRRWNEDGIDMVLPPFSGSMNYEEMCEAFLTAVDDMCDYIGKKKKSNNETLRDNIIEYMNQNYSDSAMSACTVSSEMGISEKYLYQFIREQTGKTFIEYLMDIRIAKAKEYLTNTDYSNEKIAELTGFASHNTFYRNFQKATGVTPKKYRESDRGKD
ncbi:MAG: helix-turn-helix transcriptional regulator [Lachnospiraceae bacterium]|nr:helix-turn-helix transcriptional regulator [Lachnospiraceae bacterium]